MANFLVQTETPTAYNTYTITGLPPGAIATPGADSLKVAAHPAKTPYLYFVADGKGGHTFNTNLASHNKSVQDYLKVLKEKMRSKYIVIEGLEGAGKTTARNVVVETLEQLGIRDMVFTGTWRYATCRKVKKPGAGYQIGRR